MFKIDKSSVEYLDANISFIVVKPPERACAEEAAGVEAAASPAQNSVPTESISQSALTAAKREADIILSMANERAGQIQSEARQKGYLDGYNEGRAEADHQAQELQQEYREAFDRLAAQVSSHLQELDSMLEQNILRLSLLIAKKIINIELEKNDIVFEQLLRRTIQLHQSAERFVIRLNPREYGRFIGEADQLRQELKCAPFSVISDPVIAKGGLVLEASDGIYRTGVDTQLKRLEAALGVGGSDDD